MRPCGDPLRHRHRVPGPRPAARRPPGAHRLPERRPGARRGRRRRGANRGARARLDVSRVVVVGAGIAGLAAAWDLAQGGADVTVLESERRPGGVIVTERRDGFLVEGGPDGFLAAAPDLPALARELGIGDRLVDQVARGATVWTGSRFEALAEGSAAA